jgi:hypothetical protein
MRYHVKSEWLASLPDGVVDALVEHHLVTRTSPLSQILVHQMGGVASRVPPGATAFAHRGASFSLTACAGWASPEEPSDPHVAWARSTWAAAAPASLGAGYVNHLDGDEGDDRVRAAYGPVTYERLVAVKTAWDPENVFALNHNIRPRR